MASETHELALGHQQLFTFRPEADRVSRVSGRKRRTLYWTNSNRPVFVSDVKVTEAKGIRSGKRALLVLYGNAVALLAGDVLESSTTAAADAGNADSDDPVPALKLLDYPEILSVQAQFSLLDIEHVVTKDKHKLAVGSLLDLLNEQQQQQQIYNSDSEVESLSSSAGDGSVHGVNSSSTSTNNIVVGSSTAATGSSSSSASTAAAPSSSAKVKYARLVLGFANPAAAQAAEAALLYYRAQAAAAVHWLSEGLHLGFRCQLAAVEALVLGGSSSSNDGSSSTMWRAVSLATRTSGFSSNNPTGAGKVQLAAANNSSSNARHKHAAAAGSSAAVRYPWISQPGSTWGCRAPLPQAWEAIFNSSPAAAAAATGVKRIPGSSLSAITAAPATAQEAAAAAAAAAGNVINKDITLEDLISRVDLAHGPQAIVITFSTPYGLAQATVTPQIVRAAALNSSCRQVLAVPVMQQDAGSSSSSNGIGSSGSSVEDAAPVVGFALSMSSGNGTHVDTYAGSSSSSSGHSRSQTAAAAAAAAAKVGSRVSNAAAGFECQVYAALTFQLVRTPETQGVPAAAVAAAAATDRATPAATAAKAAGPTAEPALPNKVSEILPDTVEDERPAAAAALRSTRSLRTAASIAAAAAAAGEIMGQLQLLRFSAYVMLAALMCSSSLAQQQPFISLLQLLLLLCVAAADVAPVWQQWQQQQQQQGMLRSANSIRHRKPLKQHVGDVRTTTTSSSNSSSSNDSSSNDSSSKVQKSAFAAAAAQPADTENPAAAAAGLPGSESPTSCGWSLLLLEGDVTSTPSPFLQLQIAAVSCDQQTADIRSRLSAAHESGPAAAAAAVGVDRSAAAAAPGFVRSSSRDVPALPVLVSDPEPAWMTPDIKQRFINAKPTLEASRQQAQITNEWRIKYNVQDALNRPVPRFLDVYKILPFYQLGLSPDKHAVVYIKLGGIKALCDAIYNSKSAYLKVTDLEDFLTLLNEYLGRIAAPEPLPAGNQVLLFDLEGLRLSHVMNETAYGTFQVLMKYGTYYPERLHQAIIMHAPAWFNIPWKVVASFLDANTRSKIVVVNSPKAAVKSISRHLHGLDNVPEAWGGRSTTPPEQYPAHQEFMRLVQKLNGQRTG